MALGVGLIILEIATVIGGGLIGLAGGGLLFAGLFFAFLPANFWQQLDQPGGGELILGAFVDMLIVGAFVGVGLVAFIIAAPKLGFVRRLAVQGQLLGQVPPQKKLRKQP